MPESDGRFFHTESYLRDLQRKSVKSDNSAGDPIRVPSKILAVLADPNASGRIFIAESTGTARQIFLNTPDVSKIYSGAKAPLSSIALDHSSTTLFAGCWDKSIWSWDVETQEPGRRFFGHSDFVKCIAAVQLSTGNSKSLVAANILVSGGSDAKIIIWSADTGEKLHVLQGHTRAVLDLALCKLGQAPHQSHGTSVAELDSPFLISDSIEILSAGSSPEIRHWTIRLGDTGVITSKKRLNSQIHQTSINRIRLYQHDNSKGEIEDHLWTASSDHTSLGLSRKQDWLVNTTLQHPDCVTDVLLEERHEWIITACRDENVRMWDAGSGTLLLTLAGHFEEVTGLALTTRNERLVLVSVSIDGTIRTWEIESEIASQSKATLPYAAETLQIQSLQNNIITAEEKQELEELLNQN